MASSDKIHLLIASVLMLACLALGVRLYQQLHPTAAAQLPVPGKPLEIDAELAPLLVNSESARYTGQYAAELRQAIVQSDFRNAESRIEAALHDDAQLQWRFDDTQRLLETAAGYSPQELLPLIKVWLQTTEHPDLPLLVRAQLRYQYAGRYLVGAGRSAPSLAADSPYLKEMTLAADDIGAARQTADTPYSAYLALLIEQSLNNGPQQYTAVFEQAIGRFSGSLALYRVRLQQLNSLARNNQQLLDFVEQATTAAAPDAPLKCLFLDLYVLMLQNTAQTCQQPKPEDRIECVDRGIADLLGGDFALKLQDAMNAGHYRNGFMFSLTVGERVESLMHTPALSHQVDSLLQTIAVGMGSNTELTPPGNPYHDFIMDGLLARRWQNNDHLVDAEKLFVRVFDDLHIFKFPAIADYKQAFVKASDDIAAFYDQNKDYRLAVFFADAAGKLGGPFRPRHASVRCHSLSMLQKDQDAMTECNRQIQFGDNLPARLARAALYQRQHHPELAIADLNHIAATFSPQRYPAIVQLANLYAEQADYPMMLQTLDSYPFLFDPHGQSPETLAENHSRRCLALYRLNRLSDAQNECRTALRAAPGASAKQTLQEIQDVLRHMPNGGSTTL